MAFQLTPLMVMVRGEIPEVVTPGRVAVVNDAGETKVHVGDVERLTYFRSASKPIQALPVIARGLHEKYGFTDAETTLMAGSHAGEDVHLLAVLSMLDKAGFREDDLILPPAYPANAEARARMLREGMPPRKALHNCAGKHIAALLLQRALGGDNRDYWRADSLAQTEIRGAIARFAGCRADAVGVGVDGCGVPVFATPLTGVARAFMLLACPDRVADAGLRAAAAWLAPNIHRHNLMMRGHGYLCSVFNEDENVVAKGGAQGVYGFGLKKERLGVAIKLDDGTEETWPLIAAEILAQLRYDRAETLEKLRALRPPAVLNDSGAEVGRYEAAFRL